MAPSVAGLIKAGDEGMFSSSMFDDAFDGVNSARDNAFDGLDDDSFDRLDDVRDASVSWRPIFEAFLKECAWRAEQERSRGIFGPQPKREYLRRYQDYAEFEIWRTKQAAEGKGHTKASQIYNGPSPITKFTNVNAVYAEGLRARQVC
jgi:hypothetical protein